VSASPIFGGRVVIQAKRYKNTVGVSVVRDLFGTLQNEGASKGILVTTSGYRTASFDFAQNKPIELIDGASDSARPPAAWRPGQTRIDFSRVSDAVNAIELGYPTLIEYASARRHTHTPMACGSTESGKHLLVHSVRAGRLRREPTRLVDGIRGGAGWRSQRGR
jgi:hypothetical protein